MKIYTESELQELLQISEKQAKALMRTAGFPSFKIGSQRRVEESQLLEWISGNPELKLDYSKC